MPLPTCTHFIPSYTKRFWALLVKTALENRDFLIIQKLKEKKKNPTRYLPNQNIQGRGTSNEQLRRMAMTCVEDFTLCKKETKMENLKKTCHLKHPILEKVLLLTFSSYIFYSLIFVCYFVCATCLFIRELVTVDPGTQYPGTTVELVTLCYTYNTNRCSLTYICLRDPSIFIIWKSSFPIVGVSDVLFILFRIDIPVIKQ